MNNTMSEQISIVVGTYPEPIKEHILKLRILILSVAKELDKSIDETLKWNEPSYLAKGGSTIRIAWKKSSPTQFGVYFNCKTSLVETFKEIYPQEFVYEDNRAIVFELGDEIPEKELKTCIALSLNYHAIKHLPLLGV